METKIDFDFPPPPPLLRYKIDVDLKDLWEKGKNPKFMSNPEFRKAYFQTFFSSELPPELKNESKKLKMEILFKRHLFKEVKKQMLKDLRERKRLKTKEVMLDNPEMNEDVVSLVMLYMPGPPVPKKQHKPKSFK